MPAGGKRENAGRKPKAEEQALIEHLKPFHDKAIQMLGAAVEEGKDWAVKLYLEYYYGKPKQTLDGNLDNTITIVRKTLK